MMKIEQIYAAYLYGGKKKEINKVSYINKGHEPKDKVENTGIDGVEVDISVDIDVSQISRFDRAKKIEEIKAAIKNGTYKVDVKKLSEEILNELLF